MLCHSSADNDSSFTLIDHVKAYLYKSGQWLPGSENSFSPALCHRIDRNTNGIVIIAKTEIAHQIILDKIKNREIEKSYLCIVHGTPDKPEGILKGYVFKDAKKNQVYVHRYCVAGAKTAELKYQCLHTDEKISLIKCELITGRTHQIRAQLAEAGYPLLGDGKYGVNSKNILYGEKKQALCAWRICFSFKTDASILNYLSGKRFEVNGANFVHRYFPEYELNI